MTVISMIAQRHLRTADAHDRSAEKDARRFDNVWTTHDGMILTRSEPRLVLVLVQPGDMSMPAGDASAALWNRRQHINDGERAVDRTTRAVAWRRRATFLRELAAEHAADVVSASEQKRPRSNVPVVTGAG